MVFSDACNVYVECDTIVKCFYFQGLFATSMKRSQSNLSVKSHIGDLSSGRAFHNGCTCAKDQPSGKPSGEDGGLADVVRGGWLDDCRCGAPRLQPQLEFITSLMTIGKKLSQLPTKEAKSEC